MAILEPDTRIRQTEFRKELGLRNLVTCQILNIVGLYWVGIAAKLGPSHVASWLLSITLFYLSLPYRRRDNRENAPPPSR